MNLASFVGLQPSEIWPKNWCTCQVQPYHHRGESFWDAYLAMSWKQLSQAAGCHSAPASRSMPSHSPREARAGSQKGSQAAKSSLMQKTQENGWKTVGKWLEEKMVSTFVKLKWLETVFEYLSGWRCQWILQIIPISCVESTVGLPGDSVALAQVHIQQDRADSQSSWDAAAIRTQQPPRDHQERHDFGSQKVEPNTVPSGYD